MKLTDRTLAGRPEDLAAENRELHQLRAQVAALLHACGELEQELDENVGVMNALRRQRDTAETERGEANGDRDSALQLWQQLVRQRAAVLAYLDDCDNGMGSAQADQVRIRLGATDAG